MLLSLKYKGLVRGRQDFNMEARMDIDVGDLVLNVTNTVIEKLADAMTPPGENPLKAQAELYRQLARKFDEAAKLLDALVGPDDVPVSSDPI